ncbi:MAG: Na/Pi cotransporter family protein [Rikenellaceae bacterium]|nr:Na/Pi cotransporter family protein [Rikenellaceae bacterium]MBR6759731.1 Na/Pi cotransporter family protein [Alistipes sp.]
MILQIFTLIGALGMFLYGMNLMSAGLQKAAGDKLRRFLEAMTSNRFKSVTTGLTITSIIQSSSATTVMVVGFVNAGLLALNQAIGVIMGANIGTTVTAWLISLLGFKADISILAVPLMALGFILSIAKSEKYRNISECVIGFSLLFLGLSLMKESVPDLRETPEVLSFIQGWTQYGFGSVLIFMVFGTVLTLVLQSSSATMALTLIMMSLGWIPFHMGAAMVLGENIGTTITANIAAAVANTNAKRAALAHTLFNIFGVVWALILFKPFTALIGTIIASWGYPNPAEMAYTGVMDSTSTESTAALYGLSMFHTLFNTFNTLILIWFIPQLGRIVTSIIKSKPNPEEEAFRLKYISAGHTATAELSIGQAQNEVVHFAEISRNGLGYVREAVKAADEKSFEEYRQKLVKYEEIADRIEFEIASFLNAIPQEEISEHTRDEVNVMYKAINELESLGDSGEAISRILARRNSHDKKFSAEQVRNILSLIDLVDKAYDVMIRNLSQGHKSMLGLKMAVDCEIEINELRNLLREAEIKRIEQNGSDYHGSVYYLDVLSEVERMGDFVINISQAVTQEEA